MEVLLYGEVLLSSTATPFRQELHIPSKSVLARLKPRASAVVMASGGCPYSPSRCGHSKLGGHSSIISIIHLTLLLDSTSLMSELIICILFSLLYNLVIFMEIFLTWIKIVAMGPCYFCRVGHILK